MTRGWDGDIGLDGAVSNVLGGAAVSRSTATGTLTDGVDTADYSVDIDGFL